MSHNHGPKPPKGEPWSPTVDVILDISDPKNKSFKFESADIDIGPQNSITFENEERPGFVITFHLKNPPGDYRFPENLDDALWVVDQPVCPDENNKKNNWGVFKAKAVNNNGLDLVVRNLNNDKQKFGFAPHVVNKAGDWWTLDPVGTNENGAYRNVQIAGYVIAALGGAVVGSLATLGVQSMMGS